mgnify:CR=1 FL=1
MTRREVIKLDRHKDSRVPAFVAPFDYDRIHLNVNFWQWFTDDLIEPDDTAIDDLPKILSHESIHLALYHNGLFAESKALDNRELFGTVETQGICGIK